MNKRNDRAPSQRQLRVGEEIRHTLAAIVGRGDLRDPVLQDRAITITEVRVSPDMRNATVYCVALGGEVGDSDELITALNKAQPFLRHQIAQRVHLRTVPAFTFVADGSFDEAGHIDALLQSDNVIRDLRTDLGDNEDDPGGA
ncbi:MAG TPA: 30S ribosome-binding factor RbfA [Rhodospirillales bacterium]|nr:30S ribosome-binding factor RbfA [Rhodospirillales bacterium]